MLKVVSIGPLIWFYTNMWPPYLHNERWGVGLDVVVAANPREDLVAESEGGVLRRNVRTDLSHDL